VCVHVCVRVWRRRRKVRKARGIMRLEFRGLGREKSNLLINVIDG
jgi:hypothetical protein